MAVYYELTDRFIVRADQQQTWAFFSSAENLPDITPPGLGFKILTPRPITIENDSLLDYTIRWASLPIRWRTKIIEWEPPQRFIDLQVRGPYSLWHHQHHFRAIDEGTECFDRVIYSLPIPLIGSAIHALTVRRQLLAIFTFRRKVIGERLGWVRAIQPAVQIQRL